jgi:hypothetical protein
MSAAFLCRFAESFTLTAGQARVIDIPINGATNWTVVVDNTGPTNAVTAATVARSPLGGSFGPAAALPAGIPLASGVSLEILGLGEPITTLRLTLTSTSGTVVRVEAAGW